MKNEENKEVATIDLAQFREAQKVICETQKKFREMVLAEFEKQTEFNCGEMIYKTHTEDSPEFYFSTLNVSNISVLLQFTVIPTSDKKLWFANLNLHCEELSLSKQFIEPRKDMSFTLKFTNTSETLSLEYKTGKS